MTVLNSITFDSLSSWTYTINYSCLFIYSFVEKCQDKETGNKNCIDTIEDGKVEETSSTFTKDENFLIFAPPQSEAKKFIVQEKDNYEENCGDSYTVGSTSKSSSEWRSSINYRDSGTEDPFSSSSRRSCPKWESYTVFQKYDEEMTFLDRISAQKLRETGRSRLVLIRFLHSVSFYIKLENYFQSRLGQSKSVQGQSLVGLFINWQQSTKKHQMSIRIRIMS